MFGFRAILTTAGIVFVALSTALAVLALAWLIDNFSIDRLLAVAGVLISAVALLFAIIVHLRRRR